MRNFVTYEDCRGCTATAWVGQDSYITNPHPVMTDAMRELRSRVEAQMMVMERVIVGPDRNRLEHLNAIVTDLDMELDQCLMTTPSYSPPAS